VVHPSLALTFAAASVVGASAVIAWRLREVSRPVTVPKIIMPPLGMSTGLAMFLYPPTHVPLTWAAAAFALGALVLAWPLVLTSRLHVTEGRVYVRRSRAFLWILIGLVTVRFALRGVIEHYVSFPQTAGLFFMLAFGMIVRWRAGMLLEYRRLNATLK